MNIRTILHAMILLVIALCLGFGMGSVAYSQIEISQVYGGSDQTNAACQYDFIELINNGSTPVNLLTGFLVVHKDGSANPWNVYALPADISMPAKTYYLVRCVKGGSSGFTISTFDADLPNIDVPAAGVVAVFDHDPSPVTGCPTTYLDKVGYANSGCAETASFPGGTDDSLAVARKVNGDVVQETNNNSVDFTQVLPNPHNSQSQPLPVQLVSVKATTLAQSGVRIDWSTASEIDNFGFYVERAPAGLASFAVLDGSFQAGHGTTLTAHNYSYTDVTAIAGTSYQYRIKQVDLDGTSHYSEPVSVESGLTAVGASNRVAQEFTLKQNYPNPFNPSTMIEFTVKQTGTTTLRVYNTLGQQVAELFNETAQAGIQYALRFDGATLSSGLYFARLESSGQVAMVKMTLLK